MLIDNTWLLILLLSLLGAAVVVGLFVRLFEYVVDRFTIVPPSASWATPPGAGERRVWPVVVRASLPAVAP